LQRRPGRWLEKWRRRCSRHRRLRCRCRRQARPQQRTRRCLCLLSRSLRDRGLDPNQDIVRGPDRDREEAGAQPASPSTSAQAQPSAQARPSERQGSDHESDQGPAGLQRLRRLAPSSKGSSISGQAEKSVWVECSAKRRRARRTAASEPTRAQRATARATHQHCATRPRTSSSSRPMSSGQARVVRHQAPRASRCPWRTSLAPRLQAAGVQAQCEPPGCTMTSLSRLERKHYDLMLGLAAVYSLDLAVVAPHTWQLSRFFVRIVRNKSFIVTFACRGCRPPTAKWPCPMDPFSLEGNPYRQHCKTMDPLPRATPIVMSSVLVAHGHPHGASSWMCEDEEQPPWTLFDASPTRSVAVPNAPSLLATTHMHT
jgi:hypothetical protein